MKKKGQVMVFHFSKGGVGKTTFSVQMAATLADQGFSVLLIDTDYQDQCRLFFKDLDKISTPQIDGLDQVMLDKLEPEKSFIAVAPNFHFLPAGSSMQKTIVELEMNRIAMFKIDSLFEPFRANYDYIILDTNPSLNILTFAALYFAQRVYMPINVSPMSIQSITDCVEYMTDLKKQMQGVRRNLDIEYIFPNQLDFRKPETESQIKQLLSDAAKHGIKVLPPVKECIHYERLPSRHQTLFTYEPVSKSKSVTDLVESLKTDFRRLGRVISGQTNISNAWNEYQNN